jgi:error-prone DNA polymerase
LLAQTLVVAERCQFSLDELRYEYPEELVPKDQTAISYLRQLTEEGLALRFPNGVPDKPRSLVEYELALIEELKYEPYFLTVHDIVRFARSRGILCQGRGSAANSAVCYALHITEVNPACMEMLFERFISKERNEPPDIDVDFEHERREEVIQYLYAKYGRERAALAATVITYRPKSAMRDIGKALGFDLEQVDRLSKSMAWWDGRQVLPQRLEEAGFDPANQKVRLLMQLLDELIGFPRHLSQHVGGFVIARGKLSQLVPIENAAMAERTIIQWDKDDLDALGLLKVDVLALGMLSAIRRALDEVSRLRGRTITMADIPREDPAVYDMIGHADTVGVFQIESRAQMSMLPRMRPRNFYDLVIEVAIVRPGPIQGGMVHPYLRRREGVEPVTYPSEEVRNVLQRTLGVPIFQEQVMRLTVVAAGFTPGEADEVRRSMAAWKRKGGLEHFERRLIEGMTDRGYQKEFALQIYQQILGFGEYGFPESHAASFAMLVYISAWLKCHEPAAFACALINSQPMGFYAPAQLVQDARRHGVEVLAADVTASDWDCTLFLQNAKDQPALRLGMRMVNGLSLEGALRIMEARAQKPFISIEDLATRCDLNKRDLKHLASAGALTTLAGHRRQAYWDVAGIEQNTPLAFSPIEETQPQLLPLTEGQNLVADYDSLGLTLGRHPLALLRDTLRAQRLVTAAELRTFPHGRLTRAAGLVIGRQRPGTASGVTFVTLEDETGQINVVVWRDLGERQRRELLGARLLAVYGVLERQGEVAHLIAGYLKDLTPLLGDLVTQSRDFH